MEKYNFDVIFTGTNEEQHCKASHFLTGANLLLKQAEEGFAFRVLNGEGGQTTKLDEIHNLESAMETFSKDPRTVALQKWVGEKQSAEREARMLEIFKQAIK